jgi:nitrogen fixation NifU-like protein
MDELYMDNILDHAKNPRNKMEMIDHTCIGNGRNPSCGDNGKLFLKIEDGNIIKASFSGEGCALSQAGMSMMTEYLNSKTVSDMKKVMPGDVYSMLGVQVSPSRAACALLCYNALEEAIKNLK